MLSANWKRGNLKMAKNKRFGMMISPSGKNATLGLWPDDLDNSGNGWTAKSWGAYEEAMTIGKRYNDMYSALHVHSQAPHKPAPELPDLQTRQQLAKADAKRLRQLREQMAAIDTEITRAQISLKPFEYPPDVTSALLRQEQRQHFKTLNPEQKRAALKTHQFRAAVAEQVPEISGLLPTQHQSIISEELKLKHPAALKGIEDGRRALDAVAQTYDAVSRALDFELKTTSGTVTGAPPAESDPWV
jgi:hypothetical protein